MDFADRAHAHDHWIDYPSHPLERDFPFEEYQLRLKRARSRMAEVGLDALVITTQAVGHWFTSSLEPHEWHDCCPSRSAWFILTPDNDYLYMTPTAGGEHFNTTRRSVWVSNVRAIVERVSSPRAEIWCIEQMLGIFRNLGLDNARLGFELGDCMTLGLSFNDFISLRDMMPEAELTDGSAVIRHLMSVHTPLEIERMRIACVAGVWMHAQVPDLLEAGITERQLFERLADRFASHHGEGYTYTPTGAWDVRNPRTGDSNMYHEAVTDRVYKADDLVFRALSGVDYRGYFADVDRCWHLGPAPQEVRDWYRIAWECNRAMAEQVKPGNRCCDIYAACAKIEARHGLGERPAGRCGHGYRNTGGLSVHPDNDVVLETGMVISVEPMFATEWGFFDLEDQYVVTEIGGECLHDLAPEELPVIGG